MAVRRLNQDGAPDDDSGFLGRSIFGQGEDGGGTTDEFGNLIPDFSNDPNFPTPFTDYQPVEIIGNTDSARELGGSGWAPPRPPQHENAMPLPQGVSVNEGMFEGAPQSGNAMSVPPQPSTPQLTSGMATNAIPESGTNVGPMRRSAPSPSIYGESRSPTMFGRADGLLGGGKGITGASETSGAIAPTEMMQKLLQWFRQGAA